MSRAGYIGKHRAAAVWPNTPLLGTPTIGTPNPPDRRNRPDERLNENEVRQVLAALLVAGPADLEVIHADYGGWAYATRPQTYTRIER